MRKFARMVWRWRLTKIILMTALSYGLIWGWVDVTATHYSLPFLLLSVALYFGLDVKLERKLLKQSLSHMRRRTDLYGIYVVIGTFFAILAWGLQSETWGLLALPIAAIVSYLLFAALRSRCVRIKKLIGT